MIGNIKRIARAAGVSVEEYVRRNATGSRCCGNCREWHPEALFRRIPSRSTGFDTVCATSRNARERERYVKKGPSQLRGRRYVEARDGDRRQARRRVEHLVAVGLLPRANDVPCTDCQHVGNDREHEYDHHLGYAAEHHESVQAVCTKCHGRRTEDRGEFNHRRDDKSGQFVARAQRCADLVGAA